ncbi:hypothetical protein M422DRAFT_257545 [Sphaerobolus stellatus SS14]|uniref:Unplaced genomic scaffold SPHSTscaffold_75, whole genome shotgun sequence n=1 Tax=Sphaerobolus stellatus (strain SS14) TaxID=990650 RepID=A0A0C9UXT8_SPHS4|nr:hypothetical protein M422DRAFT_257545 [Sphaerobolus stellatus SS14]
MSSLPLEVCPHAHIVVQDHGVDKIIAILCLDNTATGNYSPQTLVICKLDDSNLQIIFTRWGRTFGVQSHGHQAMEEEYKSSCQGTPLDFRPEPFRSELPLMSTTLRDRFCVGSTLSTFVDSCGRRVGGLVGDSGRTFED